MIRYFAFFALLTCYFKAYPQGDLNYFLPEGVVYDPKIPTPKQVIGHELGKWHVTHDKLVAYMKAVDAASDRITLTEYGKTYEDRPLLLLTLTSNKNQSDINRIREEHIKLAKPGESKNSDISRMPAVVWMGYSVHGNEPSGSNASLAVVYHLAAAQGPAIDSLLENTVILIDPSINPDGLNRFASWVNMHKSHSIVSDPNAREFEEEWPGARTNHYWFDLNRDWMPAQHPESQGRLKMFHYWKPNVLTDHHEMGTNSSFFFQPGVPARINPNTPKKNFELTKKIGDFHAEALDKLGSFYYSKEDFDDFYYGKGSTYPDVNGAIGILFEQASSRGHAQNSDNGVLTFPFTIRNQFATSLSTLKAAKNMRQELLEWQRQFYLDAEEKAKKYPVKAYIFEEKFDKERVFRMVEMLQRHEIEVYKLESDLSAGGKNFSKEHALVVPLDQPQHGLIKGMFEKTLEFEDSLFYDISAWTLPMAFNFQYEELNKKPALGKKVSLEETKPVGKLIGNNARIGFLMRWDSYNAPKALNEILSRYRTKTASVPFSTIIADKTEDFGYGTILIPSQNQSDSPENMALFLKNIAEKHGIEVYAVTTGLSTSGVDLGSPSFETLRRPSVMMLAGSGANSNDAGEIWHYLDQRLGIPLSIVEQEKLGRIDLNAYNTIVVTDGFYSDVSNAGIEKLKTWVSNGGLLVALGGGAQWVGGLGMGSLPLVKTSAQDSTSIRPYAMMARDQGAQVIGGGIFEADLDITHPIGYGFKSGKIALFKDNSLFIQKPKIPYATPLIFSDKPILSGYISAKNHKKIKGAAAVLIGSHGKGKIVFFSDNPNFRAFWYGTNKLFANALFFGHTINAGSAK